jgi:hypothetical protein
MVSVVIGEVEKLKHIVRRRAGVETEMLEMMLIEQRLDASTED